MVRVIKVVALNMGYRVLVCNTDEDGARQAACLSMLADERVSGIVLSPSDPDGSIDELRDLGIPVVTLDRALTRATTDLIVADNVPAVRTATQRLIDAGHRRIAFVGGRSEVRPAASARRATCRGGAGRPGTDHGRRRVRRTRPARRSAMLALPDPPSALMVANNLMALGALQAIRDHGLRSPDDIAVIAVDNPDWAELLDPPLTVLAQPIRPMAAQGAELLIRRATGEEFAPVHQVYPLELIIRRSCGLEVPPATTRGDPGPVQVVSLAWPRPGSCSSVP